MTPDEGARSEVHAQDAPRCDRAVAVSHRRRGGRPLRGLRIHAVALDQTVDFQDVYTQARSELVQRSLSSLQTASIEALDALKRNLRAVSPPSRLRRV